MAAAAVAAGVDGLIIEVHPNPDKALSDGAQSLTFENFERLMRQLDAVAAVMQTAAVASAAPSGGDA
jgi:3-deoxy-7-phosphoheptulonate synthase